MREIEVVTADGNEVQTLLRNRYAVGWRLVGVVAVGLQGGVWSGKREVYLEREVRKPMGSVTVGPLIERTGQQGTVYDDRGPVRKGGPVRDRVCRFLTRCVYPNCPCTRRSPYGDDLSHEDRVALDTGAPGRTHIDLDGGRQGERGQD